LAGPGRRAPRELPSVRGVTRTVCYLGYELHPPWNEGTRVLTRNQMDALAAHGTGVTAVSTRGAKDDRLDSQDVRYVRETALRRAASRLGYDSNGVDAWLWVKLPFVSAEIVIDIRKR